MPPQLSAADAATLASLPESVHKAVALEAANRAHGSVHDDAFYGAPAGTGRAAPGTLLKVEQVTDTSLYALPPGLALSRLMYQSKAATGRLVPVSAYVLWPATAKEAHGGCAVVAFAHGTSGQSAECAPSNMRDLWHHRQAPYALALAGYAVVATDYAGLGVARDAEGEPVPHLYLASADHAEDVAWSVVAAREAFPALSREFVVMGASQGGGAAWAFAERQAREPLDGHLGSIALCPATRILDLPPDSGIDWLAWALSPSLAALYPGFKAEDVLTETGLRVRDLYFALEGCGPVVAALIPGERQAKPDWRQNASLQHWQRRFEVGGRPLGGPLLVVQGAADAVIAEWATTKAVERTAAMFPQASIDYVRQPNITHMSAFTGSQSVWLDWIGARFAGELAASGFRSSTEEPLDASSV